MDAPKTSDPAFQLIVKMYKFVLLFTIIAMFNYIQGKIVAIDENWVCYAKSSCSDCLQLTHCQWCESKKYCFFSELSSELCPETPIIYEDKNLTIALNAECACAKGKVNEESCKTIDANNVTTICSGRGECVCGRCSCNTPDPEHPTKVITGKLCEWDNYSCKELPCVGGPYHI